MARPRDMSPRPTPAMDDEIAIGGESTGKYLVLLREDGVREGLEAIKDVAGLKEVCNAADYEGAAVEMTEVAAAEVFVLDKLKVAVVHADPTQLRGLQASGAVDGAILAVEPEQIMYALTDPIGAQVPIEYLRG